MVSVFLQQETEIHTYRDNLDLNAIPQLIQALTDTARFTKDINGQITDAIKDKYDALKDKLMLEALQKQVSKMLPASQNVILFSAWKIKHPFLCPPFKVNVSKHYFVEGKCLFIQYGDAEWAAQSEAEKQKKLMELKRKEKQLRQQGLDEEAADLVNKFLDDSETLKKLLGDEKEELDKRMKERLKRKKERIKNGSSIHYYSVFV